MVHRSRCSLVLSGWSFLEEGIFCQVGVYEGDP